MLRYYEELSNQQLIDAFIAQYLTTEGWLASVEGRASLGNTGPVPWITYPALKMLERMVQAQHRVFEYGAGNSTVWWSSQVAEIVTVEHDEQWYQETLARCGPQNNLIHVPIDAPVTASAEAALQPFFDAGIDEEPGPDPAQNLRAGRLSKPFSAFAATLLDYPDGYFDIVVVDGMARVLTAWLAAQRVNPDGFVIFDNSDRDFYQAGYDALTTAGFKRIDFWGPGPINPYGWCTSIFTKNLEVFA